MTASNDNLARRLLAKVESGVPLAPEPYAQLAAELGASEDDVLRELAQFSNDGLIREISGVFDAPSLGYSQALVAMAVPTDRLDRAGQAVAAHPGVSHCYAREGRYNLWFTLAISPQSRMGLEGAAAVLARACAAESHMCLPTVRRYKLQVRFADGPGHADQPANPPARASHTKAPNTEQIKAIRALQSPLSVSRGPWAAIAAQAGMDVPALLSHARDFLAAGWMRRYAAVLRHRAAGAEANLLVAWRVEPADADAAGAKCAASPAVSHCYLRPTARDWPYNLYTMVHGRRSEDCQAAVAGIAAAAGLGEHVELWTLKEYAKRRVKLFNEDESRWEAANS